MQLNCVQFSHIANGHSLNLACGDAIKHCKLMWDALDTSYEIIKHFAWEGSKGKECYIFHKVARWKI